MTIEKRADGLLVRGIERFDLAQTLDCGQCFRFYPNGEAGWKGAAGRHAAAFSWEGDALLVRGSTPEEFEGFWAGYFDLGRDYAALRRDFCGPAFAGRFPALADCVAFAPGIRLLRQPAFEALVGFIVSQNNNVPRIKGIVARLCRLFGDPLGGDAFAFPTPERLAACTLEDLAPLRSGWRAAYILDAADKVARRELCLEGIATLPLAEARRELMRIRGVGPKVADCVLLYGLGRTEAFPMDVWMKRAMARLFPGHAPEEFGPCAGIAQQFIFHYCRCHPEELREGA